MGPEDPSNRKRIPIIFLMPNFRKLQNESKNVSLKIMSKGPFEIRPYIPLIGGLFILKIGLRSECEKKATVEDESCLFLALRSGTSGTRNKNL